MQSNVETWLSHKSEVSWRVVQQLKLRLGYLKLIESRGYDVKDEIPRLEIEIKEIEQRLESDT
jgi:hypothetical protein